jgi:hypothetical protein
MAVYWIFPPLRVSKERFLIEARVKWDSALHLMKE